MATVKDLVRTGKIARKFLKQSGCDMFGSNIFILEVQSHANLKNPE